jgi:hypothetical protein
MLPVKSRWPGAPRSRWTAVGALAIAFVFLLSGLAIRPASAGAPPGGPAPPEHPGAELLRAASASLDLPPGGVHFDGAPQPLGGSNSSQWQQITTPTAPSPRSGAMMTYDVSDGYVLLFGGGGPPAGGGWFEIGDTWTFFNGTWTNITSSLVLSPAPRSDGAMVYDPVAQEVVLFGGQSGTDGATLLNDTWTYHAGVWTELSPTVSPPIRTNPAVTWDNASDDLVLFGGCADVNCSVLLNDTWTFQANAWTNVTTSVAPPARGGAGFTYDAIDGYDLLFGGLSATAHWNDTWSFQAGTWSNLSSVSAPSQRVYPFLAYDPAAASAILFGGQYGSTFSSDTWSYGHSSWTDWADVLTVNPGGDARGAMTYDPVDGALLLFGGLTGLTSTSNALWAFTGPRSPVTVGVSVTPSTCGPIEVGYGILVSSARAILISTGNYTAVAPPCAGYVFDHWTPTGGLTIPATELNSPAAGFDLTGAANLSAVYLYAYTVTFDVRPNSCGPITVDPVGAVPNGDNASLASGNHPVVAPPCTGYSFDHWGAAGAVVLEAGTTNSSGSELVVFGNGTLTAIYVAIQSILFLVQPTTCGPVEIGSGDSASNGSSLGLKNGTYLLMAPACPGYVFGSWNVTGALAIPAGLANRSGAELVVSGPGSVTALYGALYAVLFGSLPSSCGPDAVGTPGGILSGGSISLPNGTYLVTAPTCIGYQFDHWATLGNATIAGEATLSLSAPVTIQGTGSVTAVFLQLYSIQFIVQPHTCGPVRVGFGNQIGTNGVALLTNGTYLIEAPVCAGYVFQSWATAGDVSVATGQATTATAELSVAGVGITTAAYALNQTPPSPSQSTTSWTTITAFGVLLGIVVGAAVGSLVVFAVLRPRRRGRHPPTGR